MFKRLVQAALSTCGYRIVSQALDAHSLRKILLAQKFREIIDVGAASGSTVRQWLSDVPSAHVHAVEPLPLAYEALVALAKDYPGRVTPWNYAAGGEDGLMSLNFHKNHPTSSSVLRRTEYCASLLSDTRVESQIQVEMRRLDTLIIEGKSPPRRPVLLKLDVQGFEDRVLEGAEALLQQTDFVISEISIAPVYADQCNFSTLHNLLCKRGFSFTGFLEQFHLKDGTPVYADVVYRKETP